MQLVQLASQDALTGLPNRRRTQELALAALDLAKTAGKPLTLALIDMDHFKDINDRCGHAAGDHVLQEFARAGREALRETDILGRWGGEEFLLLMPETPVELAVASLERLRTLVFGIRLPPSGSDLQVSLSAGLASFDDSVKSFEDLVARADAALYRAKNDGRDLIRLCEADFMSTGARRPCATAERELAARLPACKLHARRDRSKARASRAAPRVDREHVAVDDDQVGPLARLETTGRPFLLERERGVDRVSVDRILNGDALLGKQGRFSARLRARDRVLHRLEGVEAADVPVAAAGDQGAGIAQRARRIEVARPLGTDIGQRCA